jgi:hypothetical protein
MESWVAPAAITLCVILSLALFALGGTDPTIRFCLRTLSFGRPTTIVGTILDTVAISCAVVADSMCEELGRRVNMGDCVDASGVAAGSASTGGERHCSYSGHTYSSGDGHRRRAVGCRQRS